MNIRLGVNIDHVATLRNVRGSKYPSPLEVAKIVSSSGASQVTVHLREDRRHIKETDVIDIIQKIDIDVNLEIAPTEEMLEFAIKYRPSFVCLVPEKREELTTEGGLNVDLEEVKKAISKLHNNKLKVCLFINPDKNTVYKCQDLKIKYVELHTGSYANANPSNMKKELILIKECAKLCDRLKIHCHAGHGLNLYNVDLISSIKEIRELNIGHSLISESIFIGLEKAIQRMITKINNSRK